MTVLQAQNMSLVLIDQQDRVRGLVGEMGQSQTDWPAGVQVDGDRLLLNWSMWKV